MTLALAPVSLAPPALPCYTHLRCADCVSPRGAFWPSCSRQGAVKSRGRRNPPIRDYEVMFIVDPTVSDEGLAQVQSRFTELAQSRGAEIKKIAPWERRRLAYEIKGKRDGIYILAELRANPAAIAELDNQLKVSEAVLRHLVVRLGDD